MSAGVWLERGVALTLGATAAVVPLIFWPGSASPLLGPPKAYAATFGVTLALVGAVACALVRASSSASAPASRPPRASWLALAMAAGVVVAAALAPAHGVRRPSLELARWALPLIVFAIAASVPAARRAIAVAALATTAVMALLLLAEEWGMTLPGIIIWPYSPAATLGHRNIAGHFLIVGVSVAAARLALERDGRRAWLWAGCLAFTLVALVATRSRTACGGALVALLFIAWSARRVGVAPLRKLAVVAAALLLPAWIHVTSPMTRLSMTRPAWHHASVAPPPGHVARQGRLPPPSLDVERTRRRLGNVERPLSERLFAPTSSVEAAERVGIWRVALRLMTEAPWTGLGPGSFQASVGLYNAHDVWLQIGAEYGVLNFAALVAATLWLVVAALRTRPRPGEPDAALRIGAGAVVLAFCAAGVLDVGALHWGSNLCVAGLAAALVARAPSEQGA